MSNDLLTIDERIATALENIARTKEGSASKQYVDGKIQEVNSVIDNLTINQITDVTTFIQHISKTGSNAETVRELLNIDYCFRKGNKSYALGDIVYTDLLVTGKKLVCVKAGVSNNTDLNLTTNVEGALITDGTVTWMIDSLADGIYNTGHQNAKYREADITGYWESGLMSANIQAGKFIGIYPGDYIVKSVTVNGTTYNNIQWIVGDCDYYYTGYGVSGHHVLMFPKTIIGTARMNSTDTTSGGYVNSEMWTTTIPKYATGISNAFGSSHILAHNELLTTGMNSSSRSGGLYDWGGASNNWAWQTGVKVNLFNEPMVYGGRVFSSSGFDVGESYSQISAMKHNKTLCFTTSGWYWLRSVAFSRSFCNSISSGDAYGSNASISGGGVRPVFLLT